MSDCPTPLPDFKNMSITNSISLKKLSNTHIALPSGNMDATVKVKLEEIRLRTPRYLFRVWNKLSGQHPSGGSDDLNTVGAIVPLAFRRGHGHASVYDLSETDFSDMVADHGSVVLGSFETELSSWTASLSCAMEHALKSLGGELETCHIRIIDTRGLWHHNQIFFFPDLAFLGHVVDGCHMEYLAHGVIRGPFHRAIPMSYFEAIGYKIHEISCFNFKPSDQHPWLPSVMKSAVQKARMLGECYGADFAIPMALALICVQRKHTNLFNEDDAELQIVVDGLSGLCYPQNWKEDNTIMQDVVFTGEKKRELYPDLRQFIHLMRAIIRHQEKRPAEGSANWTEKRVLEGGRKRWLIGSKVVVDEDMNDNRKFDKDEPPHMQGSGAKEELGAKKRAADRDDDGEEAEGSTKRQRYALRSKS